MHEAWPVYKTHLDVCCTQCRKRLTTPYQKRYGIGNGEYLKYCVDCDMDTWYDIEEK